VIAKTTLLLISMSLMVIHGNTRPATVSLVAYPMVETNFQFEPAMRHIPAAMTISRYVNLAFIRILT